jgi:hypothetical protein
MATHRCAASVHLHHPGCFQPSHCSPRLAPSSTGNSDISTDRLPHVVGLVAMVISIAVGMKNGSA